MNKNLLMLIAAATVLVSSLSCAQSEDDTRSILITGANRGIGLELARQYSASGWHVIGTARAPGEAQELGSLDNTRVLQLDVTDQESVTRFADELGETPIDVLINNAGILPMMNSVPRIDLDLFSHILAVNTVGPVRVTQAVLPNLRKGHLKKIINVTSNLGSIAENTSGQFYGYRESKAALNMFTRSLAAELRDEGFICVVLHPGWVQTDMGGPQAPVPVEESAAGLRKVIDTLALEESGTFRTWRGETMDW